MNKAVLFLLFGYIVYMCVGMFWSLSLIARIALQFSSKRRLLICFLANWLGWPVGMMYRYRRLKRNREGDGRIVF
jgi:hypothetical protein